MQWLALIIHTSQLGWLFLEQGSKTSLSLGCCYNMQDG